MREDPRFRLPIMFLAALLLQTTLLARVRVFGVMPDFMLLLAVARGLLSYDRAIRRGEWDYRTAIHTPRLRGKTLGLVDPFKRAPGSRLLAAGVSPEPVSNADALASLAA